MRITNYELRIKNFLIFGAFALFLLIGVFALKLAQSSKRTNAKEVKQNNFVSFPTSRPITPSPTVTPTLTPQQILEIQRKNFETMNKNYGPCKQVPILMYHHVMDADAAKKIGSSGLNVPPDIFREQMDYLVSKGYSNISLDQLPSMIKDNTLPARPIVLTFDDGYNDFYDNVYPVLKEKIMKATVFVISQYTGGDRYLNWNQVKEMSDSGLVLIGDHTLNHSNLPKENIDEERNQIVSAKIIIEDHIGKSVSFFAYPYGGFNANAEKILKENGFVSAVTTVQGRTQCSGLPYEWQRIRIGASSLSRYGL